VGRKLWGEKVARAYVSRVNFLHAAASARDVLAVNAYRLHPLKGERAGQHALNLCGAWRLIVVFTDKAMSVVRVEEVSDHYGD
jgi:plasmid maintenance system killer protein